MRRRRQRGNPLLAKIVGISIILHLILLPILAHYGAFKKVQREFLNTQIVTLPPPEKEKPPETKRPERKPPARKTQIARKSAPSAARPRSASMARSALSQPKVVAAGAGPGGENGDGPTVDPNGSGVAGQLPTEAPPPPAPPPAPEAAPSPPAPTQDTAASGAAARPVIAPSPTPAPPAPSPPPPPVFTEAEPITSPKPTLPDSLRNDALDKTVTAEIVVGTDGAPVRVTIVESAGTPELDQLALEAARRWRFKPATRNNEPVESTVRLHMEFQVL